jgi:hypothetical protein
MTAGPSWRTLILISSGSSCVNEALFATVAVETLGKTRHYTGLPSEVAPGEQQDFGATRVVVLRPSTSGTFLLRYTESGEFAGDTWHRDNDEAVSQASFEYGDGLGEWHVLPVDPGRAAEFVRELLGSRPSSS